MSTIQPATGNTSRLLKALKVVREVDPEMPAQSLAALLIINNKPGIYQRDLATELAVSSSSAARIPSRLGDWERYQVPGLKLVVSEIDARDRRQRMLWLTPKGQRLIKDLESALSVPLSP